MTYDVSEISSYDGEPIELYEFKFSTKAWRFTSSDEDETYLASPYTTEYITRSKVKQSTEINQASIRITVSALNPLADVFLVYPPAEPMLLTIYRKHRGAGDSDTVVIWHGRVIDADWKKSSIFLTCEALYTSLRRTGLRRHFQTQCPHVLYGSECNVIQSTFENPGTATVVSNTSITVTGLSQANGYFAGGVFIFLDSEGVTHKRAINSNIGTAIEIAYPIQELVGGDSVILLPGCQHTVTECVNKFANIINYGGFPYVPGINPFEFKTLY